MKQRPALAELRHLILREYHERAEWDDAYRLSFKRDVLIHHAMRVITWAVVGLTRLLIDDLRLRHLGDDFRSSQTGAP